MKENNFKNKFSIEINNLFKIYPIYDRPEDRLKQLLFGFKKKYFRNFTALNNVSFNVKPGECFGIVGRNGAGKSTLLQIIAGTLTPSSGAVRFQGKVAAILELGSGFNSQYSGRENIYLYASIFGLGKRLIDERLSSIIDFSELSEFIDQPIKIYSTGMVARLAFSVIAHVDADILVIDEALSVGDASFSQKCLRYLREFKKKGSILFVSHDLAAVMAFCENALWLENGKVKLIGTSKEVCEKFMAGISMEVAGAKNILSVESKVHGIEIEHKRTDSIHSKVFVDVKKNKRKLVGEQKIYSFGFEADSSSYGTGEAQILKVELDGNSLTNKAYHLGADLCSVRITGIAKSNIESPIIGFIIKDRLGQPLIGGNTYFSLKDRNLILTKDQNFSATFTFKMPILAVGNYSITAAIARGDLQFHTQLHWMHDALSFEVVESSIKGVIVGVPIDEISFIIY
jgi:lipopolysaccharide transport system ATP-binding protein